MIKFSYILKIHTNQNINFNQKTWKCRFEANDPKHFIESSNDMQDVCKSIKEHNPRKEHNVLMFDDMIADINSNKKLNPTITELFTSTRKLIISLVFTTQL